MIGASNAKKSVIWHAIAPTYGAMTVIIMDMSPWTAHIRYCHQLHQPAAGLTQMTGVGDPPLDITATPDAHPMTSGTDPGSVTLDPNPVTTAIGVVAARTLIESTPVYSTDLPIATSHMIEAPVPTTTIAIHLTADTHLIGALPEMTEDPNIVQETTLQTRPRFLIHFMGSILETQGQKTQTHHN